MHEVLGSVASTVKKKKLNYGNLESRISIIMENIIENNFTSIKSNLVRQHVTVFKEEDKFSN